MSLVNTALYGWGARAADAPVAALKTLWSNMEQALRLPSLAIALTRSLETVECLPLDALATVTTGSTGDSAVWSPKFPIRIIGFEAACVSAAGATGTVDLQVLPSGGSYATILSAPVDVKTGAGTFAAGAVINTAACNDVETTGKIKAIYSSGSGGSLTAGKGLVYFVRQPSAS